MAALTIPVQVKTATASGQTPTSLLPGELGLDPWLGRLWWADNNGNKQFASLPGIATASAAASDVAINTQNILYQGLLLAALRNVPTGLVDGILDPFSSLADVNQGKSSGYTFSSSAGTIGATVTPATSGGVVSTSSNAISGGDTSSYPAANAFDGTTGSTPWLSSQTGGGVTATSYIGQDFGAGNTKTITSIAVTNYVNNSYVTSVYLEVADGGSWTSLGTFSLNAGDSAQTTITVPSGSGAHRQWRLRAAVAPAGGGSVWALYEVDMTGAGNPASTAAMVLQSATLASAVASPSAMRALIQVDSSSAALTPNTDITVALSRDGGTTFTTGTLATVQSMPDGTTVLDTGWVSVTGQPAGNSTMTYKLGTPTQKAAVLTGISMMVRP